MAQDFCWFLNKTRRLSNVEHQLEFLQRCREAHRVPHGLQDQKTALFLDEEFHKLWNQCLAQNSIALLDLVIGHLRTVTQKLRAELETIGSRIVDSKGIAHYLRVSKEVEDKLKRHRQEKKSTHDRKFENFRRNPWTHNLENVDSDQLSWWQIGDVNSAGFQPNAVTPPDRSLRNVEREEQAHIPDSWMDIQESVTETQSTVNIDSVSSDRNTAPTRGSDSAHNDVEIEAAIPRRMTRSQSKVNLKAGAESGIILPKTTKRAVLVTGRKSIIEGEDSWQPGTSDRMDAHPRRATRSQTRLNCSLLDHVNQPVRVGKKSRVIRERRHKDIPEIASTEEMHEQRTGNTRRATQKSGYLSLTMEPVKLRKDKFQSIINLTSTELDEDTLGILSKGLSFTPVPTEIDRLTMREDLKAFERRMRLTHHFADQEIQEQDPTRRFREKSDWTPYPNQDKFLDVYLAKVTKEIMTAEPMKYKRNMTRVEERALSTLKRRQDIIIKAADKGSAVVVMDRERYIGECERQLSDRNIYAVLLTDPSEDNFKKIRILLDRMLETGVIDVDQACFALPLFLTPARFYLLPKVHKCGVPGRPVISASGSLTENLSDLVDFLIKDFVPLIPSHLKDTFDFLKKVRALGPQPPGTLLVTVDVVALYPSIPHDLGIASLSNFLSARGIDQGKIQGICDMAEFVLKHNVFEFNSQLYLQTSGTAIGTKMAPSYANIVMAEFEQKVLNRSDYLPIAYWRFIDDVFMVWTHGPAKLDEFLDLLNSEHRSLQFTADYSHSVNFLDVHVSICETGNITTEIHYKETDSHQFLDPNSCHPHHIKENLPYSQALRISRICSEEEKTTSRAQELVQFFTRRGYKESQVKEQIERALNGGPKPRPQAPVRRQMPRCKTDDQRPRIPLVLTYHPGLPDIKGILERNQPILHLSERMKKAVPELPLRSFRQPPNLKSLIVRAKITRADNNRGVASACTTKRCLICPVLDKRRRIVSKANGRKHRLLAVETTCNSTNVVYCLICPHCGFQYVGLTNNLRLRMNGHRSALRNHSTSVESSFTEDTKRLYQHLTEHGQTGFKIVILEKVDIKDCAQKEKLPKLMRKKLDDAERRWIWKLDTVWPNGFNVNDGFNCQTRKTRK